MPISTHVFFSISHNNNAQLDIFKLISKNTEMNTVLALFDFTRFQNTILSPQELATGFTFYPPEDIVNTELPKSLEFINEIQNLFLNYDRNNKEQTSKLLDFIENNIHTGFQELSTNIFLRPQKVRDYVHLYSLLSKNVKIIVCQNLICTPIFSYYLIKEKVCSVFEAEQLMATTASNIFRSYIATFSRLIDCFNCKLFEKINIEIIETFIDDNPDKFIELTSKMDFSEGDILETLTKLSALYGAVNCFKYLSLQEPNFTDISNYAVVGGNMEIIRILIQKGIRFDESAIVALYFRRDELFDWLQSQKTEETTQRNQNHLEYSITDTLTIRAIYSLTKKNRLIYTNDWLSVFSLDGLIEPIRELSKSCMFLGSLFFNVTDEEILNNFLDNARDVYILKLLDYSLIFGYSLHLHVIINHMKFPSICQLNPKILDFIKSKNPEIFKEVNNILQIDTDIEKNYQKFIAGIPINISVLIDVMKYSMNMNDLQTFQNLCEKFNDADCTIEQLIGFLQSSSLTWPFASKKIVEKEPDGSVCIPLTRYFSISNDNSIIPAKVADIIMKDQDLQSQLTAYDCINLLSMVQPEYTDISPLISLLRKFGLITDEKLKTINEIQEFVYNSPKIDELVKEDIDEFLNIIPPHLDFINKVIGIEVTKEFYDKILQLFIIMFKPINRERLEKNFHSKLFKFPEEMVKLHSDFLDFLTDPVNKKHIDIKALSKSKHNFDFIRFLEFSDEEFQILKKNSFGKSNMMFNPVNSRFFTIEEVLKFGKPSTIVHAIMNKPLNPQDISLIKNLFDDKDFSNKYNLYRQIFIKDEICQGFETKWLLFVLWKEKSFDEISFKILDELLSREMNDSSKCNLFLKIPTDKEAYDFIVSRRERINDSCLIIYSIRTSTQLVEKGTPIEDFYFQQIFASPNKLNYENLFDYKVSKLAIALGFINAIRWNNIDAVHLLISKGAPINAIINSKTPLQDGIYYNSFECVERLVSLGASLKFNGMQTAVGECMNCKNSEIISLICSKIDYEYESHFKSVNQIQLKISGKSSGFPEKEDLVKMIKQISLPNDLDLDFIAKEMQNCCNYATALNLILTIANIDLSPISFLIKVRKQSANPDLWNFVVNNITKSNSVFRTVYCVITDTELTDPSDQLHQLLFIATRLGNINVLKSLLENGASIEEVEGYYNLLSPSLEAISKNRSDILQLFISAGLTFDHIYSTDNFTLINASIEFNSMKCFDLLLERSSLRHVVVETPMMTALQTFERTGNDYFINKLIDKIDIEYERIVDPSFSDYLLFKEGRIAEFHYKSSQRPQPKPLTQADKFLAEKLKKSDLAQLMLAYKILSVTIGGYQKIF
ncbi:hypothetical protein TVAG_182750 [Trichomonas vaginalis G3]|uniref:Uncharacterized protein n=1 Tax=Trichomonas vaginalis (strain ATCC PRA-98 / G3) TaxID=412133 RepID=A2D913_TRIV3|nr:ankycorbin family [Trichomonas vaginalis G3]EAY23039.1 hypothetical protein TVAG_182750 [Trichomonas vaginalis G3]KAI5519008.1 ankycorbin family [Trichomonas vaginalis G3]|eukprot:XP_001584025.1 hypothetical protein [Trichomonas vaginalis G3]